LTDVERDDSLCLKIAREEADKTIVRQGMATTVSAGDDMENHYKNITHSIVYMIKSLRTIKAFGNVSIIDQSAVG
jgi:hypothetical protein